MSLKRPLQESPIGAEEAAAVCDRIEREGEPSPGDVGYREQVEGLRRFALDHGMYAVRRMGATGICDALRRRGLIAGRPRCDPRREYMLWNVGTMFSPDVYAGITPLVGYSGYGTVLVVRTSHTGAVTGPTQVVFLDERHPFLGLDPEHDLDAWVRFLEDWATAEERIIPPAMSTDVRVENPRTDDPGLHARIVRQVPGNLNPDEARTRAARVDECALLNLVRGWSWHATVAPARLVRGQGARWWVPRGKREAVERFTPGAFAGTGVSEAAPPTMMGLAAAAYPGRPSEAAERMGYSSPAMDELLRQRWVDACSDVARASPAERMRLLESVLRQNMLPEEEVRARMRGASSWTQGRLCSVLRDLLFPSPPAGFQGYPVPAATDPWYEG